MGYWDQSADGTSFGKGAGTWGDAPADAFDRALASIVSSFEEDLGRLPTLTEIRAGLEFALSPYKDASFTDVATLPES